jgi:hypothetical protein
MRRADERLDPANHNRHAQAGVDPINQQDPGGNDAQGNFCCLGGFAFLTDLIGGILASTECAALSLQPPGYYATHPDSLVATSGGY